MLELDFMCAVDFFREFLPQVKALPPFSLSTYWSAFEKLKVKSIVDVLEKSASSGDEQRGSGEIDIPILPVPELSYLNSSLEENSERFPSQASALETEHSMQEHDPLGVVQKLSDAAGCLSASLPEADPLDKVLLLEFEMAIAVKAARASLLLSCASSLAASKVLLEGRDMDISVLEDIASYVRQQQQSAAAAGSGDEGKEKEKGDKASEDEVGEEKRGESELLPSVDAATRLDGTKTDAYSILRERVLR